MLRKFQLNYEKHSAKLSEDYWKKSAKINRKYFRKKFQNNLSEKNSKIIAEFRADNKYLNILEFLNLNFSEFLNSNCSEFLNLNFSVFLRKTPWILWGFLGENQESNQFFFSEFRKKGAASFEALTFRYRSSEAWTNLASL